MKLYYWLHDWLLPGQQHKGASKVEIPTDAAGLCAWLNDRKVPICLPLHPAPEPDAWQEPGDIVLPPKPAVVQPSYTHQSVAIDEAWDALPLARKLHFAALAMEDARAQL